MPRSPRATAAVVAGLALLLAACGGDDTDTADGGGERPTVVVTTTTLGDVVRNLVGDQVEVVTVMPVGADPHDFQASARQVDDIRRADALVVNGAGFEEGLLDVIESAEADGVPTYEAITDVEVLEVGEHAEDEHADDEHGDEHADDEHAEEDGDDHGHEGVDPHFFQDPARTAVAAAGIGGFLAEAVDGIDADALQADVDAYVAELEALDAEVEALLAGVPDDRRVLVTNHDSFGYFADRYGFEVVGTVVPGGSTSDAVGAADLAELARTLRELDVPAVFTENIAASRLADALAGEVGEDVEVVELLTDSLGEDAGEGGSYVDLVRTNAERIAAALG